MKSISIKVENIERFKNVILAANELVEFLLPINIAQARGDVWSRKQADLILAARNNLKGNLMYFKAKKVRPSNKDYDALILQLNEMQEFFDEFNYCEEFHVKDLLEKFKVYQKNRKLPCGITNK